MALVPEFVESVTENFFGWVREFDQDYRALQDYIVTWLTRDNGIEIVGGDYVNYLQAVLVIFDAYSKRQSRLDYDPDEGIKRERRVESLINFDSRSTGYLSYEVFQQMVFRRVICRANA